MPSGDLTFGLVWELASKTAIVVALLYGVLWVARKLSNKAALAPGGAGILLLHTVHLGPGRSVHLLSVGGRTVLVGSTSQQVSFLADVGTLDDQGSQQAVDVQPFERYLTQASVTLRSLPSRWKRKSGGQEIGD